MQAAGKSRAGRPKGLPAWNKGKSLSEAAKQKISKGQKRRWKMQPEMRSALSSKLKVGSEVQAVLHGFL